MDKAPETQLANIQKRTGKSLEELTAIVRNSGLAKHGEIVAMLKDKHGMGHGDANTIVHLAKGNISGTTGTTGTTGPRNVNWTTFLCFLRSSYDRYDRYDAYDRSKEPESNHLPFC